ncbi:MAG: prepilin-type N-terminal cleavage/methylation domain-containing protein [Phycisphaerales bacterium]|nr:prepilin-type N-terminal cleavage/methylation domain-containing protein [Phycisphaerales bacterium]
MIKRSVKKAFTLIEILIVVVILGILAAIVIPQFTKASEDAQVGNVVTQLQTIRSQIELYRVRNNGAFPDLTTSAFQDLVNVGTTNAAPDGNTYMKAAPVNPRTGTSTVAAGTAAPTAVANRNDTGWIYDATTGNFWANGFDEATGKWIAPTSGGGGGGN